MSEAAGDIESLDLPSDSWNRQYMPRNVGNITFSRFRFPANLQDDRLDSISFSKVCIRGQSRRTLSCWSSEHTCIEQHFSGYDSRDRRSGQQTQVYSRRGVAAHVIVRALVSV